MDAENVFQIQVKEQIEKHYRHDICHDNEKKQYIIPEGKLKTRLNSLILAEASRMQTVLKDAPQNCLQLATNMAELWAKKDNNEDTLIYNLAAFVEIVKKVNLVRTCAAYVVVNFIGGEDYRRRCSTKRHACEK